MCKGNIEEQARVESFCGTIKSFNTRRGFGFVSCEETAQRFGRDVYLSKDEAMVLAVEPAVGLASAESFSAPGSEKVKAPPPVQEGDFLLFQVKLSAEGFPQAVQPQKIRRLRGMVVQAPSSTAEGIIVVNGEDSDRADANADAAELFGAEVRLRQAECGQLQLQPNDEVAFCCVNMTDADGQSLEAQLVDLLRTSRSEGSVLGCFSLSLPKLENTDDGAPNMQLHGHALTNRIVMSDVPYNLSVPDLMRLFSKLGGTEAFVNSSRSSASISFSGPESIAKFLVQATHTISENGITQLAHVGSCLYRKHGGDCCFCAPNASCASRSNMTAPLSTQFEVMQPSAEPCFSVVPDSRVVPAPMLLSTPPMSSPQGQTSVNFGSFLEPQSNGFGCVPEMPMITRTSTTPAWRCMHHNIVIPSAAPEMLAAGDNGCGVCIQWPTVIHASAYVVELLDQVSMVAQRFMHMTPEGVLPALMNLRVDGLQPSAYATCVRCVAPCGCESSPSPWSFVSGVLPMAHPQQMLAPNVPHMLPPNVPPAAPVLATHSCPPPPSAPPSFPSINAVPTISLAPIPEDTVISVEACADDILTLD